MSPITQPEADKNALRGLVKALTGLSGSLIDRYDIRSLLEILATNSTPTGTVPEAPADNLMYVRRNALWEPLSIDPDLFDEYVTEDEMHAALQDMSADRIGKNIEGDSFQTRAELNTAIANNQFYYRGIAKTPERLDWTVVIQDESAPAPDTGKTSRYTYDGIQWVWDYCFIQPYTVAERAALDSGITEEIVDTLDYATAAEALLGTEDSKIMSPLTTKSAVAGLTGSEQIGLGTSDANAPTSANVITAANTVLSNYPFASGERGMLRTWYNKILFTPTHQECTNIDTGEIFIRTFDGTVWSAWESIVAETGSATVISSGSFNLDTAIAEGVYVITQNASIYTAKNGIPVSYARGIGDSSRVLRVTTLSGVGVMQELTLSSNSFLSPSSIYVRHSVSADWRLASDDILVVTSNYGLSESGTLRAIYAPPALVPGSPAVPVTVNVSGHYKLYEQTPHYRIITNLNNGNKCISYFNGTVWSSYLQILAEETPLATEAQMLSSSLFSNTIGTPQRFSSAAYKQTLKRGVDYHRSKLYAAMHGMSVIQGSGLNSLSRTIQFTSYAGYLGFNYGAGSQRAVVGVSVDTNAVSTGYSYILLVARHSSHTGTVISSDYARTGQGVVELIAWTGSGNAGYVQLFLSNSTSSSQVPPMAPSIGAILWRDYGRVV
jgi:hypothetical protein